MSQPRQHIASTAVQIIALPRVILNKLGKISVVVVTGNDVESVISVSTCRHVDICPFASDCDRALPADGCAVEGMPCQPSDDGERPHVGPSLGEIRGGDKGFKPPGFFRQIVQGEKGEHGVDARLVIQHICVVAGRAPVFHFLIGIVKTPLACAQGRRPVSFTTIRQIKLHQEAHHTGGVGLGIHSHGAIGIVCHRLPMRGQVLFEQS